MKYTETGFRAVYKRFCVFMANESIRKMFAQMEFADMVEMVLCYGYIDHASGLTLEIVALAKMLDNGAFVFKDIPNDIRFMCRIGAVENEEFYIIDDPDESLAKRFESRLEVLKGYEVSEGIEESRKMTFLDGCRNNKWIDDIMVYLMKHGCKTEGCWVRISGLKEHSLKGILLNEPDGELGCHQGDEIEFSLQRMDDRVICCAFFDDELCDEDLENGRALKLALERYKIFRTEQNIIALINVLSKSWIWIPCNAIIGKKDEEALKQMVEKMDNLNELAEKTYTTKDEVRLVPDILQSGEEFFFPVFANAEDMGEYGDHFSKVAKHMTEAIILAKNNDKKIEGIVVNAFSDRLVINKELWEVILKAAEANGTEN